MNAGRGKQVARGAALVFAVGAVVAAVVWAQGRYAVDEGPASTGGEPAAPVAVEAAGGEATGEATGEAIGEAAPGSAAVGEGSLEGAGARPGAGGPKRRVLLPSSKFMQAPDLTEPEVKLDPLPAPPPERRVLLPSSKAFMPPDLEEEQAEVKLEPAPSPDDVGGGEGADGR